MPPTRQHTYWSAVRNRVVFGCAAAMACGSLSLGAMSAHALLQEPHIEAPAEVPSQTLTQFLEVSLPANQVEYYDSIPSRGLSPTSQDGGTANNVSHHPRWLAPMVSLPIHQRVMRPDGVPAGLLPAPVVYPFEYEWVRGVDVERLSPEVVEGILEAASRLKDVEAFSAGSGPNSNERMPAWLASDRTVVEGTPRAYAVLMLVNYGWGLDQWPYLDRMWWHESGWDPKTVDEMQGNGYGEFDPTKTWGIPQANPASKMASAGDDWMTNPKTQIRWGLGYIQEIYGSPQQAWEAWRKRAATGSYGWY